MSTQSQLSRKVQLSFAAAILALAVVGAICYRSMTLSIESDRWVRHTHEVIENLEELLSATQDVESSYRGFVLTGRETYLDSYHSGVLRSTQLEGALRNLTADNPGQQQRLSVFEKLAAEKIQFGDAAISLRQTQGLVAAADSARSEDGQRLMDECQDTILKMQGEELRLLAMRSAEANRRVGETKDALIVGILVALIIAAAAGWSVQRDSSLRGRAEELLVRTVTELKRSNNELQQFAYVASHDLQEPLRMVSSFTQLLGQRYKGRLGSEGDEFIAYAVDGSNRMQVLIQDLLAYSRAGSNSQVLRKVPSEHILKDALKNLRGTIETSGAVVTHDALPALKTDDAQLVQVFQNLVGNAIKYRGPEPPRVHVSATKNGGGEWIFSVRDNGMGIEQQYFEKIFVLFQRLHGREEFEGTGIGLAICKKIVERLGGRIWVESQLQKGSTFHFALPEMGEK